MKRIIATAIFFLFLFSFVTKTFAVICDGKDSGYEWDGASTVLLANGETNCNVSQGIIRFKIANDENAVYFAIILSDNELTPDNTRAGFTLNIEGSEVTITSNQFKENYNSDKFTFDGAMSINETGGSIAEIRVGFKEGIPQTIKGSVRFIDYQGEPSNYYNFEIINNEYIETTAALINPVTAENTTEEKTTKVRKTTTERKTTERKTTEKKTTTKKSTTKKKKTTTKQKDYENIINIPKFEFKTSQKNTTHKSTTKKNKNNVTVYYVEKEVIITHIYVTSSETLSEEQTTIINIPETAIQTTDFYKATSEKLENSKKYKETVIIIASLVFLVMFGWTVSGIKNNSKSSENKKDE